MCGAISTRKRLPVRLSTRTQQATIPGPEDSTLMPSPFFPTVGLIAPVVPLKTLKSLKPPPSTPRCLKGSSNPMGLITAAGLRISCACWKIGPVAADKLYGITVPSSSCSPAFMRRMIGDPPVVIIMRPPAIGLSTQISDRSKDCRRCIRGSRQSFVDSGAFCQTHDWTDLGLFKTIKTIIHRRWPDYHSSFPPW